MKKYLLSLAGILLFVMESMACDACGAASSVGGIGLLNNFRNNIAGIRYSRLPFAGTARLEGNSDDCFHVGEAYVRYQVLPRFRVLAQVPFRQNVRTAADGEQRSISGLSDVRLMGIFTILDNLPLGENSNLYWEVGAGAKLPTGEYDPNLLDRELPDNFNLGNGAWGWLVQSNAVLSQNGFGVSLSASAQWNGESSDGYRFGHQFSGALAFFSELSLSEKAKLVPFAGLSAEKLTTDEHANGNTAHSTGGHGVYATGGVNFRYDRWQVGANLSQPSKQKYSDGEVEAKLRLSAELNFFF